MSVSCANCGTANLDGSAFCDRCGGPLINTPRGSNWIIGSDPACDLLANASTVSSRHCRLSKVEGVWWIEDLGSTNGTYVNGNRINEPVRVEPGFEVTLGKQFPMPWPSVSAPCPKGGDMNDNSQGGIPEPPSSASTLGFRGGKKPLIIGSIGAGIVLAIFIILVILNINSPITCATRTTRSSKEIVVKNKSKFSIKYLRIKYNDNQSFSLNEIPPGECKIGKDTYIFTTPKSYTNIYEYIITYENGNKVSGRNIPKDDSLWSELTTSEERQLIANKKTNEELRQVYQGVKFIKGSTGAFVNEVGKVYWEQGLRNDTGRTIRRIGITGELVGRSAAGRGEATDMIFAYADNIESGINYKITNTNGIYDNWPPYRFHWKLMSITEADGKEYSIKLDEWGD